MDEYNNLNAYDGGSELWATMWNDVDPSDGYICEYCRDYHDGPDTNKNEPAVKIVLVKTSRGVEVTEHLCDDCHFLSGPDAADGGREYDRETFDGLWDMFVVNGTLTEAGFVGRH